MKILAFNIGQRFLLVSLLIFLLFFPMCCFIFYHILLLTVYFNDVMLDRRMLLGLL